MNGLEGTKLYMWVWLTVCAVSFVTGLFGAFLFFGTCAFLFAAAYYQPLRLELMRQGFWAIRLTGNEPKEVARDKLTVMCERRGPVEELVSAQLGRCDPKAAPKVWMVV